MLNASLKLLESPIENNDTNYFTEENKTVWKSYFKQKEDFIKKYNQFILQDYIDGFHALEFNSNKIPSLEELNAHLKITGWKVIYVEGYLNQQYYAELLSQKIAPISRYMRSIMHLNYAPGPDMLHDILGHLPMLFSSNYSDYIVFLGTIMAQKSPNTFENHLHNLHKKLAYSHEIFGKNHSQTKQLEKKIQKVELEIDKSLPIYTLLGRFFMWTIEFGILFNNNKFQMYGAGLLSSENESVRFCEGQTKAIPFTYAATKIDYDFSSFQKQLFFSDSFKSLTNLITNNSQLTLGDAQA